MSEFVPVEAGLARPAAIVAVGTIAARVTGLGRLLTLTYALGVTETRLADTFNIANSLPNILYELILGGVLASVFIPLVVDALRDERGRERVGALVGTAVAVLFAFSALAALASPFIVRLFTFRAGAASGSQGALATFLFRFFAFQILFYGLSAIAGGLLNVRGRFAAAAFAPVANNLVAMAVFILYARAVRDIDVAVSVRGQLLLGAGTTAAVAAMAAVQLLPAWRATGGLRLRVSFREPLVRRLAGLSAWTVVYVIVTQIAALVILILANGTQGGPSAFVVANTFFQLPCGVVAVSIMTALAPALAIRAREGDFEGFRGRVEQGIGAMVGLLLPASVLYIVIARPAMRMLLRYGQTSTLSADYVARILQIFTVTLVGYSLWLFFLRAFYAQQDARTPVLINLGRSALTIVLGFALYPRFRVEGLAWADVIGWSLGSIVSMAVLSRRLGGLDWAGLARRSGRVVAATVPSGALAWVALRALEGRLEGAAGEAVTTLGVLVVGTAAFIVIGRASGVEEVRDLRRALR